jgi:pimeloyl-ACP methyl ester carboxylesterase
VADLVLVHGLWNRGWWMTAMARRLKSRGYKVLVFSYPTRDAGLDSHADALYRFIREKRKDRSGASPLHLVGHSLGGLVILNMHARYTDLPQGRIVLLGSPVKGAAVVERLRKLPGQKFLFGEIKDGLVQGFEHSPEGHETGVICGTRAFGFGRIAGRRDEPNDGSVSVSETELEGLKDRVELEVAHSEMLISPEVVEQVDHFLSHGTFKK